MPLLVMVASSLAAALLLQPAGSFHVSFGERLTHRRHAAAAVWMNLETVSCDSESCDDGSVPPPRPANPSLTAPGEEFKKAIYTKEEAQGGVTTTDSKQPFNYTLRPGSVREYPPVDDALLKAIVEAAEAAVSNVDNDGQEAYGDWIRNEERLACIAALEGLRGRKLVWWLDSPRPLRSVVARSPKYEVSIVALPGDATLPAAAFPRGSNIFCVPLLGQFSVRRLRFDITGRVETPIELMKRTLNFGVKPLLLSGGSCHEFTGTVGVASAFLQLVMLPPTSNFPAEHSGGDGSIGWRRPPGESCESNIDVVSNVALDVALPADLMLLDRPTAEALELERELDRTGNQPGTAPKLVESIGERVGGLDGALSTIVRRALATRLYPAALTRNLGLSPVRGMLLYGPPGCGKTLLAREIAQAMGAREPKIVNGPEMMSKFVGDSEQFIRALFAEAEVEQAEAGDASALHVIVFDEMDAFTRERGSLSGDTSGIRDSVVNQLLAIMDGVDQLDNILVVGLTNRPELMDPALLRPGRLEVQVLVPKPDAAGRKRIAAIHSKRLRERGCLDARAAAAISSEALAETTEGFSGADISGLLRSATSFALERYVDERLLQGFAPGTAVAAATAPSSSSSGLLEVRYEDLVRALREVNPTGSAATRAELANNKRGAVAALTGRLRKWRRERKLKRLTDRALAQTAGATS